MSSHERSLPYLDPQDQRAIEQAADEGMYRKPRIQSAEPGKPDPNDLIRAAGEGMIGKD